MIENVNELRLGNYVEYRNMFVKVYSIEGPLPRKEERFSDKYILTVLCNGLLEAPYDEFDFIELTDEILLRFGFDKFTYTLKIPTTLDSDNLYFGKDAFGDVRIIQGEYYIGGPIKYLHQLQNIYFDLSGEEFLEASNINV